VPVALLAALLALSDPAFAYRPFDSTDADAAESGEIELELEPLGYLYTPDGRFIIAPDVVVNLGLREGYELVLEGRHRVRTRRAHDEPRSRVEDTGLFLKTIVRDGALQDAAGPSVALEFGALLPTVNHESGMEPRR
jgi:hypothetical protein